MYYYESRRQRLSLVYVAMVIRQNSRVFQYRSLSRACSTRLLLFWSLLMAKYGLGIKLLPAWWDWAVELRVWYVHVVARDGTIPALASCISWVLLWSTRIKLLVVNDLRRSSALDLFDIWQMANVNMHNYYYWLLLCFLGYWFFTQRLAFQY